MSESYPCLEALDKEFTLRKQHDGTRLGGIGRVAACVCAGSEWAARVGVASQTGASCVTACAVFLALCRTHGMF